MHAWLCENPVGVDALTWKELPTPQPQAGQVLIAIKAASLNFPDLLIVQNKYQMKPPLPFVPGSEYAGVVEAVGEGVTHLRVGQNVACLSGTGGFGTHTLAPAALCFPLPEGFGHVDAAAFIMIYATSYHALLDRAALKAGETVLILGAAGGVGTAAIQIAKAAGARVIACAGSDDKAARLRELGADEVVNYRTQSLMEAVHALVGKPRIAGTGGVDVVVNFTGGNSWQECIRCLKVGGRLLTCGATAGFEEKIDVRYVWTFELALRGSNGWRREDITALLELARSGRMPPVIDKVLPLERIHEAERLMEQREVFGKIVVTP